MQTNNHELSDIGLRLLGALTKDRSDLKEYATDQQLDTFRRRTPREKQRFTFWRRLGDNSQQRLDAYYTLVTENLTRSIERLDHQFRPQRPQALIDQLYRIRDAK